MTEISTLRRLKLPPSLYKRLATTNLIESPESGVARRTTNVKYRRDQTVSEKSPAVVTCGRWPRFSGAKPRLKPHRRK
jgi:hypothetical protein